MEAIGSSEILVAFQTDYIMLCPRRQSLSQTSKFGTLLIPSLFSISSPLAILLINAKS
jgi:hypothetical protein